MDDPRLRRRVSLRARAHGPLAGKGRRLTGVLAIVATELVAGWSLLRALGVGARSRIGACALAFGLGHAALLASSFLCAAAGMPLTRASVLVLCAAIALGALAAARGKPVPSLAPVRRPRGWREWAVVAAVVGALVAMAVSVAVLPVRGFDTRMIWAFHSRLIFEARAYPPALLQDPTFVVGHPRYPPGVSLVNALAAIVTGAWDDRVVLVIPLLFYAATVALLASELLHRDRRWGLYLTGAFALMPMLTTKIHGGVDSGYVDCVVSFYTLAAAVLVLDPERAGSRGSSVAAGLMAAAAAMTKNEGLVLALMVCAAAWVRVPRRPVASLRMAATVVAIVVPWKIVQAGLAGVFEERYGEFLTIDRLVFGLGRAGDVGLDMLRVLFLTVSSTGLLWWIVGGWWLASGDKSAGFRERGLWIVPAYGAVVFLLYLITPWEGVDQVQTSFDRLALHVAPLALWAVAGSPVILYGRG